MNDFYYYIIMLMGVVIAGFAQVLLKKSAKRQYSTWLRQYMNIYVIAGYFIMIVSTICTVIAMKKVPLITTPIWNSMGIILAALFGKMFFAEKIGKKKMLGLIFVIIGIILFSIP